MHIFRPITFQLLLPTLCFAISLLVSLPILVWSVISVSLRRAALPAQGSCCLRREEGHENHLTCCIPELKPSLKKMGWCLAGMENRSKGHPGMTLKVTPSLLAGEVCKHGQAGVGSRASPREAQGLGSLGKVIGGFYWGAASQGHHRGTQRDRGKATETAARNNRYEQHCVDG